MAGWLLAGGLFGAYAAAWAEQPVQVWRFTHASAAPWGPPLAGGADLVGQTITLGADRLDGPKSLDCGPARVERLEVDPEGLFEGNLPAPAQNAARNLGFGPGPVATLGVTCADAGFDFHHADANSLLLGLDNRVWTLSRAPGATAAADSPGGLVERLLEAHFNGDMGFTPEAMAAKRGFLSPALVQAIDAYFSRPRSPDDVPPIDGDPFTDSQEYPTRFSVGQAAVSGDSAQVPVRFADGWRQDTVHYALTRRDGGPWRVYDILYPGRTGFRGLLDGSPQ